MDYLEELGCRHLTEEEITVLKEFEREMRETIIPEIQRTIDLRNELAQKSRNWFIGRNEDLGRNNKVLLDRGSPVLKKIPASVRVAVNFTMHK